jgi:hypothetical protein
VVVVVRAHERDDVTIRAFEEAGEHLHADEAGGSGQQQRALGDRGREGVGHGYRDSCDRVRASRVQGEPGRFNGGEANLHKC